MYWFVLSKDVRGGRFGDVGENFNRELLLESFFPHRLAVYCGSCMAMS